MCYNSTFTTSHDIKLVPKISQNIGDSEHDVRSERDIDGKSAKKEKDKNEIQKVEKKCMTPKQEAFWDQFSEIMLGTRYQLMGMTLSQILK